MSDSPLPLVPNTFIRASLRQSAGGPRLTIARSVAALSLAAVALLGATGARAGDPVTDAVTRAYAPYRAALFRTNGNSQAESTQAIEQARKAWAEVVATFGDKPPAPYDRDAGFAASLAKVGAVYAKAADEIRNNQLAQAHETLEEARDVLSELRKRNQVVTFSDHMNAYHEEMEHVLKDGAKLLAAQNGMAELTAKAGVLEYLARRLATEAPADLSKNGEFADAAKAVQASVAALKAALVRQDAAAAKEALGKLKVPYSRMFLRFG